LSHHETPEKAKEKKKKKKVTQNRTDINTNKEEEEYSASIVRTYQDRHLPPIIRSSLTS
jgi:hypothetical protein